MQSYYKKFFSKTEENIVIRGIRDGLVMAIPVLMIGSFSLILRTLPITHYQQFLKSFCSGILIDLFSTVHDATFGFLSLYMVCSVSIAMSRVKSSKELNIGAAFTSLVCFFLLSGVFISDAEQIMRAFGARGTFTAIITAVTATYLYFFIKEKMPVNLKIFADGVDTNLNSAVSEVLPTMVVVSVFAVFNIITVDFLHAESFSAMVVDGVDGIFAGVGRSFLSGLMFVLMSSFLWFFGMHGSDVMEGVTQSLFEPAIQENISNIALGLPATEILSKTFFDVFVLIGGCGSTLCLLAAVLLFSGHRSNKNLARIAAAPMLFNINELMVFGFPVVFNPALFIPFLLTPVATFVVSYLIMSSGLVPIATVEVEWTTPILLGGYMATGSLAGSVLQFVNLILGMLIYKPFVGIYDREKLRHGSDNLKTLIEILKKAEENNAVITLTEMKDSPGAMARMLVGDLTKDVEEKQFNIYYQPQHNNKGDCIGGEALLRWEHKVFGMIYPPLVIKLAEEADLLGRLEESIFRRVAEDVRRMGIDEIEGCKIAVNVSAATIQKHEFITFLKKYAKDNNLKKGQFCIEITEQAALTIDENLQETFALLHQLGFLLAIDDFSMGATSLKYLQKNQFDLVKLDGSLVKEIEQNSRSKNIIASIVYLAQSLGFSVLAEFVETEDRRQILEQIGCTQYQGYLYSPAIPAVEFEEYLNKFKRVY